ncbi:Putative protein of unknown function [Podospora comata]|uniref:3CxxC-type domain-containing protein n=1 Tax=Podospora comata TaxID=48703 RepID=A0ABY6SFL9_PODCO|nr:Putative protein of unknown function [Podospora comata]
MEGDEKISYRLFHPFFTPCYRMFGAQWRRAMAMFANQPLSKRFRHANFESSAPLFGSTSTRWSTHKADDTTVKFPSLHADIEKALGTVSIIPKPWFNDHSEDDGKVTQEYFTHVMGRFKCQNQNCSKSGWSSNKVGILIRQFSGNGYYALVFKQRCRVCDKLGVLRLDEDSYVERVVYRLKKWAGIHVEKPVFGGKRGEPHERKFCEACLAGYDCQKASLEE